MSKLEKTKVFIDFLKSIIIALIVGLFGMFSYLVINIENINTAQILITATGIILNILVLVSLIRIVFKKINELEDL